MDGSVITGTGKLEVVADSTNTYSPEAIGLAAAGLISIAGTIEANVIGNKSSAGIGSGGLILADSVTVNAHDESDLDLDTGVLAVGLAAAGVSASVNVMSNTVEAVYRRQAGHHRRRRRECLGDFELRRYALALGTLVTGIVGGVANITINALSNTTSASLRDNARINSAGDVLVHAEDTSDVTADSAGLAISLFGGVAGSLASNTVRIASRPIPIMPRPPARVSSTSGRISRTTSIRWLWHSPFSSSAGLHR